MLPHSPEEKQAVIDYMNLRAPDLTVEFVQKVYTENVLSHEHQIWDVHTNVDRWWVITNPTNLYSQQQFPNMDLAVTFHVGLCLRVPRSQKQKLSDLPIEPLVECYRYMSEASDALDHAQEVTDYQAIGVRCREALLAFTNAAQTVMPWVSGDATKPKRADFKAWVDHICSVSMSGQSHEHRRQLFKTLLNSSWTFSNWLTHTKASKRQHPQSSMRSVSAARRSFAICAGYLKLAPPAARIGFHRKEELTRNFQISSGNARPAKSADGLATLCRFSRHRIPTMPMRKIVPRPKVSASFRPCRCAPC